MKIARMLAFWALSACIAPALLGAQAGGQEAASAYARAVGEHFRVPPQEVTVLSEWGLALEEVPVVLFLARRGGVSADALVTIRKGGQSWYQLAQRSGLDAGDFHVALAESDDGGPLSSTYTRFRAAGGALQGVTLEDREVVGLVNLRFLADFTRSQPGRVLQAAASAGSWVLAYRALVAR